MTVRIDNKPDAAKYYDYKHKQLAALLYFYKPEFTDESKKPGPWKEKGGTFKCITDGVV